MKYKYNNQWKDLNVKVSDTYPIGAIAPYGGETAPTNWLICDGSAVSRTTYADLFSVIGTSFGAGDGSTTFNLPDLRSRVPLGKDSRDEDFDTIGETYGEKKHTLTIDEMPSHNHSVTLNAGNTIGSYNNACRTGDYAGQYSANSVSDTGGSQAHNIVQPSLVTNYIIKAFQSAGIVGNVAKDYTESDIDVYNCNYINLIGKTIIMRGNSEQEIPANTQTKVTNTNYEFVNQFQNNEITYNSSTGEFTINSDRIHTILINTQLFFRTSAETYQYIIKNNTDTLIISNLTNIKHPMTFIVPVTKDDILSVRTYVTQNNALRNDEGNVIQVTVLG